MISSADFQKISMILLDVDGTLTDGRYAYLPGDGVLKWFDMQDLHWLKLAHRAGLQIGILSGCQDPATARLAEELPWDFVQTGATDKLAAFEAMLQSKQLPAENCLYAGDDVVDMPILKRVGVPVLVANAVPELDELPRFWRTHAPGGRGAVREIVRKVLTEQNKKDQIMERYRR